MKNSMATITNATIMKHGWYQIINKTVHYYQTAYDIALILEQVSNYNILLREQIEKEKDVLAKQDNMINDKNMHSSKLCASAKEHTPKRLDEKSKENDSNIKYDAWIKPKSAYQ